MSARHVIQNLKPGDLVHVRRCRWRVSNVRPFDACQLITLTAAGGTCDREERRVIAPFDAVDLIHHARRGYIVGRAAWRRACREAIAAAAPPGGLLAARHGRMDFLPHQLEPALALLRGIGSRALLADEVGLGKTVQAALAIAELRARHAAERVLILTPAGLREQWAQELRERLDIDATIADAPGMRRRVATLPVGVSPWTGVPVAIASVDYVKRPEVLPAVAACQWDVIVVDEAHNVSGDSDRLLAVDALCARAAYVLLLTATPHSGDRRAFTSLCRIGSRGGDPLMIFRRTRRDVRLGGVRRVHRLFVRPTSPERRMHALLARFTATVRTERGDAAILALSVLHKRALSSARSLERSVERRLASIVPNLDDTASQLALPLDDGEGELNVGDDTPAWDAQLSLVDPAHERQLLVALRNAARKAAADESKVRVLRRLLRRVGEPAVVFTEYRDTLSHIRNALHIPAALLHGGLSRGERAAALAEFSSGRTTLLLATDAAGEGLNLHQRCRLVINLELPWNPMRLEQRIGRVDRIGQRRTVHAVHLIARDTREPAILDRLKARMSRARADIDVPDPVGDDDERAVALLVVAGGSTEPVPAVAADPAPSASPSVVPHLERDALSEVERLESALAIRGEHRPLRDDAVWLMRARHRCTRARLRNRILLIARGAVEDGEGQIVESALFAVTLASAALPLRALRDANTLAAIEAALSAALASPLALWHAHAMDTARAFAATRLQRERAIADDSGDDIRREAQPGLFDRRVQHAVAAADAARQDQCEQQRARIRSLEAAADLRGRDLQLLLAIAP